jgi:hypothetical protein
LPTHVEAIVTIERSPWNLDGLHAALQRERLSAEIELDQPAGGLQVRLDGGPIAACILAPEIVLPQPTSGLEEAFVRGNDLIVAYLPQGARPLRTQAYWRWLTPASVSGVLGGFELIVSQQTSLLECDPQLAVASRFTAGEVVGLRSDISTHKATLPTRVASDNDDWAGCWLVREVAAAISYMEMVHPDDLRHAAGQFDRANRKLTHRLFPQSLEKGVILRARLRGFFVPRDGDTSLVPVLAREFAASGPPLTA